MSAIRVNSEASVRLKMLDAEIEQKLQEADDALDERRLVRYDVLCAEIKALEQERATCR